MTRDVYVYIDVIASEKRSIKKYRTNFSGFFCRVTIIISLYMFSGLQQYREAPTELHSWPSTGSRERIV